MRSMQDVTCHTCGHTQLAQCTQTVDDTADRLKFTVVLTVGPCEVCGQWHWVALPDGPAIQREDRPLS